MIPPNKH